MNYKLIYDNLVKKYKELNLQKGGEIYVEKHHIIPRCIGGTNTKENLVTLPAKAHYIAHLLLTKVYPKGTDEYNKMLKSWWLFKNYSPNSSGFTKKKEEYVALLKLENTTKKRALTFSGQKHTVKTITKLKEADRGYCSKKVICVDTRFAFKSIRDAARILGVPKTGIQNCCSGKVTFTRYLKWKYLEDSDTDFIMVDKTINVNFIRFHFKFYQDYYKKLRSGWDSHMPPEDVEKRKELLRKRNYETGAYKNLKSYKRADCI